MHNYPWKKSLYALSLVGVALLTGTIAFAQLQAGRIVGQVFDPQHAAVPGATVTVTNSATNDSQVVKSDGSGNYVVTPLNPGTYSVSVSGQGFATMVRNGIELTVGEAAEVDLSLKVGAANTKVEVTTEGPILETQSGSLNMTVTNTEVQSLPLNGRQFTQLAELSPGVAPLPASGNTQNVRPESLNGNVFDGINGQESDFLLDGGDITAHHEGGTQIMTSIDATQEYNVESSPYSAEYTGVGAAFNTTTKSGGDKFHGDLFEFVRNQTTDARGFFALAIPELKRNQFGGTIGGPLTLPKLYNGKNKTFFFASYEGNRQVQGLTSNVPVPTQAQLGGDFSAPGLHAIYDPTTTTGTGTRTQFTGNKIPAGNISSVATFFDKLIPLPNSPNGLNYISNPVQFYRYDNFMLRVDQVIHNTNRIFARYSTDRNRENDASPFPLLTSAFLEAPATDFEISLTSSIGPHIVNEVLYNELPGQYRGFALLNGQGVAMDQAAGIVPSTLAGLISPGAGTFPIFGVTSYLGGDLTGQFGDGRPKGQNRYIYEWVDNLTWEKGRHLIKTGVMIENNKTLLFDSRTSDGSFSFSGAETSNKGASGTGDGFADWLLGYPNSATRGNYPNFWGGAGTFSEFYVQDDWRATEKLTITAGMRYQYMPWLTPYLGQGATFDPTKAQPIIVSSNTSSVNLNAQPDAAVGVSILTGLIQTTHTAGLPLTVTNISRDLLGPRFGFSWRPFGEKTVIRGGIGQYYQIESTNVRLNFNFIPFDFTQTVNATTNVVPTQTTANFFLGQAFGAGLTPANTPLSWAPIPEFAKMASNAHWSFGVERQLPFGMVVDANYVGTTGRHLPGTLNVNDPTPATGAIQPRRPYTNFGTINYNNQNASSIYHSFQASVHKRVSDGLWYTLAYTFEKNIDKGQQVEMGGDGYMARYVDGANIPQILTIALGYSLPFGSGKQFMNTSNAAANAILGGWQFQTIGNFRSGTPWTPTVSTDVANIGVGSQHPNVVSGGGCVSGPSLTKPYNAAAFAVPAALTYGNSGVNVCYTDNHQQIDASLSKDFNVTEGSKFQFRFEAFNVPNLTDFSGPSNTNIDSSTYGQITSISNTPRQLQFALKYVF